MTELDIRIKVFSLAASASRGGSIIWELRGASGRLISMMMPCLLWKKALLIDKPW